MRKFLIVSVVVLAVALLVGCAQGGTPSPDEAAHPQGIEGKTTIGVACPFVEDTGSGPTPTPCPVQPTRATIELYDSSGTKVTTFTTGERGEFRLTMPPGRYTLVPLPKGDVARAGQQTITVEEGEFHPVEIRYQANIN